MFFKKKNNLTVEVEKKQNVPTQKKQEKTMTEDKVKKSDESKQNNTTINNINQESKKIKKVKKNWDNSLKLLSVDFPKPIEGGKIKKRYKVNLTYKSSDGKIRKKTIRFGKVGTDEYVDNGDALKKQKISGKLGNTHNIFHTNFWRLHLLNGDSQNIGENYQNLISNI